MPLVLLAFLNPLSGTPVLSFSPRGAPALIASNAPTMHRERVEIERKDNEEVRAPKSLPRGDLRPLRNERELIHCARIPGVISGRRVGQRRRYRKSSFAPLFHARFILLPTDFSESCGLIRDSLNPVTEHKRVHSLTPCLPSEDSSVSCHYECHRLHSTRQNRLIDRSISSVQCSLLSHWWYLFSSLSLSQPGRSCDVATLTIRATSSTTPSGGCARGKLGAKCQKSRHLK